MTRLPSRVFVRIVDQLVLAVLVFERNKLVYANAAAERLARRIRTCYRMELDVMVRDHLVSWRERSASRADQACPSLPVITLLTGSAEPLYIHVIPVSSERDATAVTIRALGPDPEIFQGRYRLSRREAQVAQLVLDGCRNSDIAATLGISPATAKKHVTHIFDKVGVDTRNQLMARLL